MSVTVYEFIRGVVLHRLNGEGKTRNVLECSIAYLEYLNNPALACDPAPMAPPAKKDRQAGVE